MLEASKDIPCDPQIAGLIDAMAGAMGGDEAHRDALIAAYRIGWLAGQSDAKATIAAQLDRALFGAPLPRVPMFLQRQAH